MKNLMETWITLYLEQKQKLYELANSKNRMENYIGNHMENLLVHLVCYFVWSSITTTGKHWEKDVYSSFSYVSMLKGKNRYPNKKELMNLGFTTALEEIRDHIKTYITKAEIKEDKKVPKNIDIENLQMFMSNYVLWLCNELSRKENKGQISINSVRKELRKLYK